MADTIKSVDVPAIHGLVALNPDGTAIGTPVGGATSNNQTNGSQKTQIVDAGGEVVTVTGGKLDVNATASLAGESLPILGATEAVGVAIVDGSGNQITSFGGGTQYTEGDTDATITGTVAMVEGAANAIAPMTQPLTDTQLRAADVKITLDGESVPVTNAGITTIAGAVSGTEMQVDVLTMPTVTVTATNLDVQSGGADLATSTQAGAIQTSVELIDDAIYTDGSGTPSKAIGIAGTDGTNPQIIKTDSSGELQVDVLTMPTVAVTQSGTWDEVGINDSGNSITVDGNLGADLRVGSAAVTTSNPVPVQPPASGYLNIAIDQTGNNNAVDVLTIAAGDNNIGNVDIASIAAGDNNIGNVDIVSGTVTTVSTLTGGGVAHDSSDSGNPHKIGFKAYSPDGTTPGTAVAEGDRTDAKGDLDGRLLINDEHPRYWSFHSDGTSALTDQSVQADPGDGFQIVITSIIVGSGAATSLNFFLEEGSTKIFGPYYLEAIVGRGFSTPAGFKKHVTASTAVTITTSAAIQQAIDIQGYIQAV